MKTMLFIFAFLWIFSHFFGQRIVSSVDGVEFFVDLDTIKKIMDWFITGT